MNLKEAHSILEIPEGTSPEAAKKKYRELTKKFHPDISKEPGAEEKFKKINEAYQVVSSGKGTDRKDIAQGPFGQQFNVIDNINVYTTISFKEAVLGCKKELKFKRNAKCPDCGGQGQTVKSNGCDKCGGRGQIMGKNNNMIFFRTCDKCYGRIDVDPCKACSEEGFVGSEVSISVAIPGGRSSGDVLRLGGMGHYAGNFGPFEQNTDAHLHITVIPEPGLIIQDNDVVSTLGLSLQEVLTGKHTRVKTIEGERDIEVKPLSKNKDEIVIPNLGVNGTGNHRVILNVHYPKDVTGLIDLLMKQEREG